MRDVTTIFDIPETECPFCLASPHRVRRCRHGESTYTYACRDCGHYFDTEFHFKDPTDWKDE